MATQDDVRRYRANWQDEIDSAALYRALAVAEHQPQLSKVYAQLAATEEAHADFWAQKVRATGNVELDPRPSWRSRTLAAIARRFGPQVVLPIIANGERADSRAYDSQAETRGTPLPAEERSHARVLATVTGSVRGGLEGSAVAQLEGRHRSAGGNALRAAVLGANDGLVSNLSLVMGVAGAELSPHAILVTGVAGLLAGAASMALGEWLSVQSSRELYERQIGIEKTELQEGPAEEEQELALIYQAKGIPEPQARELAARLIANASTALDTLVREELGIDPEEL